MHETTTVLDSQHVELLERSDNTPLRQSQRKRLIRRFLKSEKYVIALFSWFVFCVFYSPAYSNSFYACLLGSVFFFILLAFMYAKHREILWLQIYGITAKATVTEVVYKGRSLPYLSRNYSITYVFDSEDGQTYEGNHRVITSLFAMKPPYEVGEELYVFHIRRRPERHTTIFRKASKQFVGEVMEENNG